MHVQVYSDSLTGLAKLDSLSILLNEDSFLLDKIWGCYKAMGDVSFHFVPHEYNRVAHSLARHALGLVYPVTWSVADSPPWLIHNVHADLLDP